MNTLNKIKKSLLIAIVSLILLGGIFVFAPKREIKELKSAVFGSLQSELTSTSSDLFNCGGRNDCPDDAEKTIDESQHKYTAQAYDKFGFPLSGVKYKWTQDDQNDIIKFRELNPASGPVDYSDITQAETDQEIYIQPNEINIQNGEATVSVLGYLKNIEQGKSQSVDVNLFFCLNTWPSTATFPFVDKSPRQSDPYTNFKTFYCKDRGSATNPGDDYASLKVVERAKIGSADNSYLCSGGGGNNLKCNKDYFIKSNYDNAKWIWTKNSLNNNIDNNIGIMPNNISSSDGIGIDPNKILATEGAEWAYYNGSEWSKGNTETSLPEIIPVWPAGQITNKLKPTALAINGNGWIMIEGNFYAKNDPNGQLPTSTITTLAEAGWPTDVQFPDDVAWWSNGGNSYLLALKGDYYRIYSKDNICNTALKCQTPSGREWGNCSAAPQCYWGELFSLYSKREWPTSIITWQDNIKFPIKTIGLYNGDSMLATSSCEYSGGICLLKEFLLISNPACSDGIDNDNDQLQPDGGCDWQDNLCGAGINKDPDCSSPDDNSESGTCDDGLDNDNDGSIDYPADFSCELYGDIEENGCANNQQCCDSIDNDSDGLVDQADGGCDNKTDNTEANVCADGIDNDGDGLIDLFDPGCLDALDNDERGITQCDDEIDNDGDGNIDYPADFGCDRSGDDQELNNGANQCNDGIDNDGDGFIDQSDPNCTGWNDNNESI